MGFLSSVGVLVCFSLINDSTAKAVIGFAGTGAVSHQAAFARVGLELVERGHKFAILVSAGDKLTQARFAKPPFENLRQILYSGPPELGTDKWLSNLERAPQKVGSRATDTVSHQSCELHRPRKHLITKSREFASFRCLAVLRSHK